MRSPGTVTGNVLSRDWDIFSCKMHTKHAIFRQKIPLYTLPSSPTLALRLSSFTEYSRWQSRQTDRQTQCKLCNCKMRYEVTMAERIISKCYRVYRMTSSTVADVRRHKGEMRLLMLTVTLGFSGRHLRSVLDRCRHTTPSNWRSSYTRFQSHNLHRQPSTRSVYLVQN